MRRVQRFEDGKMGRTWWALGHKEGKSGMPPLSLIRVSRCCRETPTLEGWGVADLTGADGFSFKLEVQEAMGPPRGQRPQEPPMGRAGRQQPVQLSTMCLAPGTCQVHQRP